MLRLPFLFFILTALMSALGVVTGELSVVTGSLISIFNLVLGILILGITTYRNNWRFQLMQPHTLNENEGSTDFV